jgi:hypothetical protein
MARRDQEPAISTRSRERLTIELAFRDSAGDATGPGTLEARAAPGRQPWGTGPGWLTHSAAPLHSRPRRSMGAR